MIIFPIIIYGQSITKSMALEIIKNTIEFFEKQDKQNNAKIKIAIKVLKILYDSVVLNKKPQITKLQRDTVIDLIVEFAKTSVKNDRILNDIKVVAEILKAKNN